jgi:hypothetical protein
MKGFIDQLSWLRHMAIALRRDPAMRRRFGVAAPRYAERIHLDPAQIRSVLDGSISRSHSGLVYPKNWTPITRPTTENSKLSYSLRRWRDGMPWESTGAIEFHMDLIAKHGSVDHCKTETDVLRRLDKLDAIWEEVSTKRMLRPVQAVRPYAFREAGGVLVHLGPAGEPIFGGGGHHRLGMALAANLTDMPCQLGAVHPSALILLEDLRRADRSAQESIG